MFTKLSKNLKDCAFLVGYNPENQCVYSSLVPLLEYYETDHPWDDEEDLKSLRLHIVHGYLFDDESNLIQEFESIFDISTGSFIQGWARDEDGVLNNF